LIEFSEDYIDPIFQQRNAAIFLFVAEGDTKDYTKVFEKAATELKGKILFVISGIEVGI